MYAAKLDILDMHPFVVQGLDLRRSSESFNMHVTKGNALESLGRSMRGMRRPRRHAATAAQKTYLRREKLASMKRRVGACMSGSLMSITSLCDIAC